MKALIIGISLAVSAIPKPAKTPTQPVIQSIQQIEAKDLGIEGVASWYDYTLKSGWSSKGHYVCASKEFPRGTTIKVSTSTKSVNCLVTDYGPAVSGRIVDLSSTAFSALAPTKVGLVRVKVEKVK